MSKKAIARQQRNARKSNRRNDAHLIQSAEFDTPTPPKKPKKEPTVPKSDGQKRYDAAFKSSDIIFGAGPAGTGKTWFSVQRAAEELAAGRIDKIYVTRPAVEVGEGMGFLPGDLDEKFEPYLAPLRDAFCDAFGSGKFEYFLKEKKIEPIPLAFMRGRSLKDSWLLADEMQNATKTEFKMLLTRIGENCKYVINGDSRQIDDGIKSGFEDAINRVKIHPQISVIRFDKSDIVRSGLCQDMVEVYED